MKPIESLCLLLLVVSQLAACSSLNHSPPKQHYFFAWPGSTTPDFRPRGGTTRGVPVQIDTKPSPAWKSLQAFGIPKRERDRRAILAMAGVYKVTFDFLETVFFAPNVKPQRPYQSWATEYVFVIKETPTFVSLQHIMVMNFLLEDGTSSGPMVMKHWRQDWTYEDVELFGYEGDTVWRKKTFSKPEVRGLWSQAVFQVDDSPRYEVLGEWQHDGGRSQWISNIHLRPLPRREFSVRSDYDVLEGRHRISITHKGWVHEQDNAKVVSKGGRRYLAQEIGLNRYSRLIDFDYSAGTREWERTQSYWGYVREYWKTRMKNNDRLELRSTVSGRSLYEVHFDYLQNLEGQTIEEQKEHAQSSIDLFTRDAQ